jgi:hypothetical protein
MLRRIATLVVAGVALTLIPVSAGAATTAVAPAAAQAAKSTVQNTAGPTQTRKFAATCQGTFHARPTTSGAYSDPCAYFPATVTDYSYAIDLKFYWDCTGGCHITSGWAVLRICRLASPYTDAVSVDVNSLNFWSTKAAFQIFNPGGAPKTSTCDTLTGPAVTMKGCGSADGHLIGTPGKVVSIMARGRGTMYGHNPGPYPDFLRIPNTADGLFDTDESYYWIGRGGVCGT